MNNSFGKKTFLKDKIFSMQFSVALINSILTNNHYHEKTNHLKTRFFFIYFILIWFIHSFVKKSFYNLIYTK